MILLRHFKILQVDQFNRSWIRVIFNRSIIIHSIRVDLLEVEVIIGFKAVNEPNHVGVGGKG